MKEETPLRVIWRHRWIVLATFLIFAVGTAIVSKALPKVYATSSTLVVSQSTDSATFDAVQAAQVTARSYADLIASPNIATQVARRLGTTRDEVQAATSFEPKAETQLLKITAEDREPARAKAIADAYADVFVAYAAERLATTTKATVSLADAAPLPDRAARPKPTLYVALASILGLALGLALALLRERLDLRLRSPEDIERRFGLPVLARVPRRRRSESSALAFEEAFRVLRTNLQFATPDRPLQTIVVTSAGEGEGKTTVTSRLGAASGEIGAHVLLVDGDLRRPALQQAVMPDRLDPLRPGLSNYLLGGVSLLEVVHPSGRPGVELLPAGPLPPSLADLLESARGRGLIGGLRQCADLVLMDCPPLNVGADASVLAGRVDGVILVVDLEASTEQDIRQALRQLRAVRANVLGMVINRDRSAESRYYDDAGANERIEPRERSAVTSG